MSEFQKSQAAKILASYSNTDEIIKGGKGSGRHVVIGNAGGGKGAFIVKDKDGKRRSFTSQEAEKIALEEKNSYGAGIYFHAKPLEEAKQYLTEQYHHHIDEVMQNDKTRNVVDHLKEANKYKALHDSFKDADESGKENDASKKKEYLDKYNHHKTEADKLKKSEELNEENIYDIIKARGQATPIGGKSKDGRYVKTSNGWELAKKHEKSASIGNAGEESNESRNESILKEYSDNTKSDFSKLKDEWNTSKDKFENNIFNFLKDKNLQNLVNEDDNEFEKLPETRDTTVSVIKAGNVTAKNMKDNEIVQSWESYGDGHSYFLIDDKYIVSGSGKPEEYIGKDLKMRLVDDGNKTTKFDAGSVKNGRNGWQRNNYSKQRNVTQFASNLDEFIKKLPKGTFAMYAMK